MTKSPTISTARPTAAPAATLIVGAFIVPLVFWIGIDEAFVIPKLVVATAIVSIGWHQLSRSSGPIHTNGLQRIDGAVAIWTTLVAVSFLASVDRNLSWWGETFQRQGLYTALVYTATYALARLVLTDLTRVRLVMRSVAVAATVAAGYGAVQRLGLDPVWDDIPANRVFATIGQTNSLGALLSLSFPLTIGLALTARRYPAAYAMGAALQIGALSLTLSRGAFLAMIVAGAMLTVFVLGRRQWRWPAAVAVTVASAMGILVVASITPGIESNAGRVVDRAVAEDEWSTGSIRNHLDLWTVAGHVIADYPIVGAGPDTFPEVFGDYRDDVLSPASAERLRPFRVESPHNIVLATAAGSGIPAALAQLSAIVMAVGLVGRRGWANRSGRDAVLWFAVGTAVVAGFVASMFITADLTTTWLSTILVGGVAGSAAPTTIQDGPGVVRSAAGATS